MKCALFHCVLKPSTSQYWVDLYDKEEFSAVGLEAPLVYADLIKSGHIMCTLDEERSVERSS